MEKKEYIKPEIANYQMDEVVMAATSPEWGTKTDGDYTQQGGIVQDEEDDDWGGM